MADSVGKPSHWLAIGQIQTASGSVTVTRPDGIGFAVKPGDLVYQGQVIETAADGAVGITFKDGTTFKLSDSARMALDEFACDPKGGAKSAHFSLARGTFAFIAGELAKTGKFRIETPVASIRGRAQSGGIGTLALAALTFSVVQESLAANPDDAAPDDDSITVRDLLHGTFTLAIKDSAGVPTGQVVTVDNPEETIVIRRIGSTVSVDHVTNSTSRMTNLQGDYDSTVETLRQGYTFLQQTNPTDFASAGGAGTTAFALALPNTSAAPAGPTAVVQTAALTVNSSSATSSAPTSHPATLLVLPILPTVALVTPSSPATISIGGIIVSSTNPADISISSENIVNARIAQTGFAITGTETGGSGSVTVSLNGQTYTATVQANGSWSLSVSATQAQALSDGSYTVTATALNGAGDPVTTSFLLTVAETLPTVAISPVVAGGNNVINHAEELAGVGLSGSVTGLAAGSVFTITVADGSVTHTYQATGNSGGTGWTATIPSGDATTLPNGTLTVTAQVTDHFDNQSVLASQIFTVVGTLDVSNTVPSSISVTEGQAFNFTGANAITISDPDAAGTITTTLSVLHGTLAATASGSAHVSNSGTGSVTITGSQTDINATLATLSYTEQGAFTSDTLTVATQDQNTNPLFTTASTVPITVFDANIVISGSGTQTLSSNTNNQLIAVTGSNVTVNFGAPGGQTNTDDNGNTVDVTGANVTLNFNGEDNNYSNTVILGPGTDFVTLAGDTNNNGNIVVLGSGQDIITFASRLDPGGTSNNNIVKGAANTE